MLYHLLVPLIHRFRALNLFNYITFRAAGAAVTALLLAFIVGPMLIRRLRNGQVIQSVRDGTPETHRVKGGTPTMGGLIILFSCIVSTLLWARLSSRYIWLALGVTAAMGAIGLLDDVLKVRQRRAGQKNQGLVERYKLMGQVSIGLLLGLYVWQWPLAPNLPGASTTLPFFKYVLVVPISAGFAWLYVVFTTFVLTGTSNAVNLTDGLDGLAAGLSAIAFATFAVFAYAIGRVDWSRYLGLFYLTDSGELTVFCAAMAGALLAFLWFNSYPAQIFMGDTGSLALGGGLGAVAILLKSEFLLVFIGGVFLCETLSVMIQRGVFKFRRRRHGLAYAQQHRVFLRAPIHHHFEVKGWPEAQVVVRFWILGIMCSFLALATLKVR
ncbi:MAG TPA: phospho-N-acetylmuramoyl-pentapeptide-transferase [Gemmatimonadaceae bacterium]|jgi:phospho-N-acetylmuramoyl-pentapeptide-transferase|nr:phospho-N-acetylmuramoyl-pentapeptide-transferase [Gemmatimonadaceae bacterium]